MSIPELIEAGYTQKEIASELMMSRKTIQKVLKAFGVKSKGISVNPEFTYKRSYLSQLKNHMIELRQTNQITPEQKMHLFNVENEVKELTDLHCEDKMPIRTRDIKRPHNWKPVVVNLNHSNKQTKN